jgi:hypothetical protein
MEDFKAEQDHRQRSGEMSKELWQSQHDPHQICIYRDADNHRNSITCARDGLMVHSSEDVNFITLAAKLGPLWDLGRDIDG